MESNFKTSNTPHLDHPSRRELWETFFIVHSDSIIHLDIQQAAVVCLLNMKYKVNNNKASI